MDRGITYSEKDLERNFSIYQTLLNDLVEFCAMADQQARGIRRNLKTGGIIGRQYKTLVRLKNQLEELGFQIELNSLEEQIKYLDDELKKPLDF